MTPRRLTTFDLAAVADLEKSVFSAPWSERSLSLLCTERAFGYGVFDEQGRTPSYAGMLTVLDEGQITNIVTRADCRRKGLATAVLRALLDQARARRLSQVTLEVRESNLAAIALYEKFGFVTVGKRPRFYTCPAEAALVMAISL